MSLTTEIEKLQEQAAKIAELRELNEDVFDMKADLTVGVLVTLIKKLSENLDELLQLRAADSSVIEFSSAISNAIAEAIDKVAAISKTPTIENKINFDTQPLVSIATNIEKQNNSIIDLVKKLPVGDQAVLKEIVTMIIRNTEYINKAVTQVNYTEEIKVLSSAIQNRPRAWSVRVTERTAQGFWNEAILKEMNSAEEKKIISNKR